MIALVGCGLGCPIQIRSSNAPVKKSKITAIFSLKQGDSVVIPRWVIVEKVFIVTMFIIVSCLR